MKGPRSVRLDRQRLRLRPLAHGGIVERDFVVAELVQQEQVDRGRDAATAIADRALVLGYPWAPNFAAASARGMKPLVAGSTSVAAGTVTLPGTRPGRPHGARPRPAST